MSLRKSTILASIYLGYVFILTLYPFEFSPPTLQSFNVFEFFTAFWPRDFVLNIFLFIPLGIALYCRLASGRRKFSAIIVAAIWGAAISLLIELLQIVFARNPSASDVLANGLGTATGAGIAALWPSGLAGVVRQGWERLQRSWVLLCIALLCGVVPLVFSVVQFAAPFGIWNPRFTLQIGNEATFNRPWLGKIHFVALYNRSLPADEIKDRALKGFGASRMPNGRTTAGLISLYAFNEGQGDIVHDLAELAGPVDLHITPRDRVRWLDHNGIEILWPAILRSRGSGTKLVHAFNKTHELSIEMWITPGNTSQGGPARIVSFSRNTRVGNFTVGQRGSNVEFRLRTPITGRRGAPLALRTTSDFLNTRMVHIVATYDQGVQRLYANGVEQAQRLDLLKDGIVGFGARKTPTAQIAYSWFYFFPVGFFSSIFLSTARGGFITALLLPAILATGLLVITEFYQALVFDRALDLTLMAFGLFVGVLGAATGTRFVAAHCLVSPIPDHGRHQQARGKEFFPTKQS